jgi:outer membrane protein
MRTRNTRCIALLIAAAAVFLPVAMAGAQQITRVAVLDLPKVVASFPQETAPLKQFEEKKAEIQAEADRQAAAIRSLQAQKQSAEQVGQWASAGILDAEIADRTQALKDYVRDRQAELELMAKVLGTGATFLQRLNQTIRQVAEAEGYSVVLNLKPESGTSQVLWYSGAVDLTDKVIQAVVASSR